MQFYIASFFFQFSWLILSANFKEKFPSDSEIGKRVYPQMLLYFHLLGEYFITCMCALWAQVLLWLKDASSYSVQIHKCHIPGTGKYLVFVKDTSLYFTNHGHERRSREIVITNAKHEVERSLHYCKWGRHIKNSIPSLDERLVNTMLLVRHFIRGKKVGLGESTYMEERQCVWCFLYSCLSLI